MKGVNELMLTDQSSKTKTRRPKSREVSSRFMSPNSTPSRDMPIQSPKHAYSPHPSSKSSTPPDARKHWSLDQDSSSSSGFVRGLWPSSTTTTSSSSNKNFGTLADHLRNERLKDYLEPNSHGRQRSCSEFNRSETEREKGRERESAKENHRPILGGSIRYTGKFKFPGKSSSCNIVPGRLSIDENDLYSKSNRRRRDSFLDNLESESDCSSPAISTKGSRKSGIEVSSKYLQDVNVPTRPRRMTSDSNIQNPVSLDSSPRIKKFSINNAIKRANSLTGYGSATSQWALSPGRSGSPPLSFESRQRPPSFSSLKPPGSPSRAKGVEKLLNLGLDFFKSKKSSSSPMGSGDVETVQQIRMLHNRLLQWRFANARADAVNRSITTQVEDNFLCAWESLKKLQQSVLHKKLQLQKEKLQMKLDFILKSQLKSLESWGHMERQHLAAVSMTKECLHSVVCRVPLVEGAKMDPQAASIALRHTSDIAASIKSMLASFSPSAEETVLLLIELAKTVAQEKLLVEEFLELSRTIAMLEIQERSLKSFIIQLK